MRALVREGSDATRLTAHGVEVVRGDLVDPASLEPALDGVRALVTTAAGYVRRRKGDSLAAVDDRGNRKLGGRGAPGRSGSFRVHQLVETTDELLTVLADRGLAAVTVSQLVALRR